MKNFSLVYKIWRKSPSVDAIFVKTERGFLHILLTTGKFVVNTKCFNCSFKTTKTYCKRAIL